MGPLFFHRCQKHSCMQVATGHINCHYITMTITCCFTDPYQGPTISFFDLANSIFMSTMKARKIQGKMANLIQIFTLVVLSSRRFLRQTHFNVYQGFGDIRTTASCALNRGLDENQIHSMLGTFLAQLFWGLFQFCDL